MKISQMKLATSTEAAWSGYLAVIGDRISMKVIGEFDIVTLVSASDIEEFRDILKNKIMKIKGVKSTVSSIVLKAHKGPKCSEDTP